MAQIAKLKEKAEARSKYQAHAYEIEIGKRDEHLESLRKERQLMQEAVQKVVAAVCSLNAILAFLCLCG